MRLLLHLFLFGVLAAAIPCTRAQVVINEFMAQNATTLLDEDREYPDWIELLNTGAASINLENYSLSDNLAKPKQWTFPKVSLGPNQYLVVFASGKGRTNNVGQLHTNFQLESSGGFLGLFSPDGSPVSVQTNYPPQEPNISYGWLQQNLRFFSPATPGMPNLNGFSKIAPRPVVGPVSGAYPTSVVVTAAFPAGAKVHYTLDGSEPGATSPAMFEGRLTLTSNAQFRARVIQSGAAPSPTVTRIYNVLAKDAESFSSNLPILIMNTYGKVPMEAAKIVHGALFIPPFRGRTRLTNAVDIDTHGTIKIRGSSSATFPQRSYAFEVQDEEGRDQDVSPLGLPEDSDWVLYAPYSEKTLLRNVLSFELGAAMGLDAPKTMFVEVFMDQNGGKTTASDYVGLYVLMEKVKRGKNRVPIQKLLPTDNEGEGVTGGYIFKKDRLDPGDLGFTNLFSGAFCFVEPKEQEITPAQKTYLTNWLFEVDMAVHGPNFTNAVTGYRNYIDVHSFINNHLLVEAMRNIDGHRLSTFYYKDRNGKLVNGPVWDYNFALGNPSGLTGDQTTTWYWKMALALNGYAWYPGLFNDPEFSQEYVDRYGELRATIFSTAHLHRRMDEISAYIKEAADRNFKRWPGQTAGTYAAEIDYVKTWSKARMEWIDSNWLPRPQFSRPAGRIPSGTSITITHGTGVLYYTLDGSDPRAPGGLLPSPAAVQYGAPIVLNNNARLVARLFGGSNIWSAPLAATYIVQTPPLLLTEIMHQPSKPLGSTNSSKDFSFLEFKNVAPAPFDFGRVSIKGDVRFQFPPSTVVPAGGYVLVVKNRKAFEERYGSNFLVAGEFEGSLDTKDSLVTEGALLEPIASISFDADEARASYYGFSLVLKKEEALETVTSSHWRASSLLHGSPGKADLPPAAFSAIRISEVLANSETPDVDAIEIYNPGNESVNISRWWLTDDPGEPFKYQFPAGSAVGPKGYLVVSEKEFGNLPQSRSFAFGSGGDEALLFSADEAGNLTGFLESVKFGASAPGVVFGFYESLDGVQKFAPLEQSSFTKENWGFKRSSLVISEIMIQPPDVMVETNAYDNTEDEFIEIHNPTTNRVDLALEGSTTVTRISGGIEFTFPPKSSLFPKSYAVLVNFAPTNIAEATRFRQKYRLDNAVKLFGPYQGKLNNSGDRLALQCQSPEFRWITQDEVTYQTVSPWSTHASGTGKSLHRKNILEFGDTFGNWVAAPASPGRAYSSTLAFTTEPADQTIPEGNPVEFRANASGTDIRYQWRKNRVSLPGETNSVLRLPAVRTADQGIYDVVADTEFFSISSREAVLTIQSTVFDQDGDGMPDAWETQFGLSPTNPLDSQEDPDHDGASNLMEFQAGTNPTHDLSVLEFTGITRTSSDVEIRFRVVEGNRYQVEWKDHLSNGSWNLLSELTAGPDEVVLVKDPLPPLTNSRYYRVKFVR